MNRFKGLAIGAVCMIAVTSISVSAEMVPKEIALDSVKILVNGKAVQGTNLVYEDSTYVPLRAVFETIGCTVNWDEESQTANINGKIKIPDTPAVTFVNYEEAHDALKKQYDVLITIAQQNGQNTEVTRLQQEFTEKEAALKVEWDEKGEKLRPVLNMQSEEIELDAILVLVNDKPVDAPNILYQDRTYVALRSISDSLGCEVNWDEATRTACISGELIQDNDNKEEVYTSYEEEYTALKEKYDKLIAEQIAMGDQRYKDILLYTSDGDRHSLFQLAEAERKPYLDRAEELKEEFSKKVKLLKTKYHMTESE